MKIKGVLLTGTVDYIKNRFGNDGWEKVLENLPEKISAQLKKIILPGGYYDAEIYIQLHKVLRDLFDTDGKLWQDIGKSTAEASMELYSSVFKKKLTTPVDAVKGLVPLLADMLFGGIKPEIYQPGDNTIVYILRGTPIGENDFTKILAERSVGWINEVFYLVNTPVRNVEYEIGKDEKGNYLKFTIEW